MRKIYYSLLMLFIFYATNALAGDYVIGGGDSLQISVWGNPELSIEVTVRPDGKISMPSLGEIKASGSTPLELTSVLEKELTKMIKTPIVTVIVTGMTNYRIFVIGKGAPAGAKTLQRETTLLEFLAQLGALDNADLESSYLVRGGKKIKVNFAELFDKGDFSQDIGLEPNDIVYVPDNFEKRITVVGAVKNPTTIPYRKGLTILDIILSAGGFTEFARENDVKILRTKDGNEKTEISIKAKDLMKGDVKENVPINPGDFIIVRESIF